MATTPTRLRPHLWRSPYGATYLVTNTGTQDLGENQFADTIWQEARQHPQTAGTAA
jgi:hypothetical protein